MNYLISLRVIKPMFATTVVNCCRTSVNQSLRQVWTKPSGNVNLSINKSRFGGLITAPGKQMTLVGGRAMSKNTAPVPAYKNHDHSSAWVWERIMVLAMMGTIPFFVNVPSASVEYVLVTFVAVHVHRGLEAICTDYLRPCVVGNFVAKCIPVIVFIPVAIILYGILDSIWSGRGIAHVLKQFWHLKTTEQLKGEQTAPR